jgi:hypothetical protein
MSGATEAVPQQVFLEWAARRVAWTTGAEACFGSF